MSDNQPVVVTPAEGSALPQNSSKAIVSLIFGILSFFPLWGVGAIVALILGYMAKSDIRKRAGELTGEGMATAGIILGWVNLGITLLGICIWVVILLGVFTALGNIQY